MILRAMDTVLTQVAYTVEHEFNSAEANISQFSNAPYLHKYILTDDEKLRYTIFQPRLLQMLAGYQKAYPHYSDIRILLANGIEDVRMTAGLNEFTPETKVIPPYFESLRHFTGEVYS